MNDKENKRLKWKNKFIELFDENNDGKLDINDIILKCLRLLPGVKINREKFLRKVLKRKISQDKIDLAIMENPTTAGIDSKFIDKIAKKSNKKRENKGKYVVCIMFCDWWTFFLCSYSCR